MSLSNEKAQNNASDVKNDDTSSVNNVSSNSPPATSKKISFDSLHQGGISRAVSSANLTSFPKGSRSAGLREAREAAQMAADDRRFDKSRSFSTSNFKSSRSFNQESALSLKPSLKLNSQLYECLNIKPKKIDERCNEPSFKSSETAENSVFKANLLNKSSRQLGLSSIKSNIYSSTSQYDNKNEEHSSRFNSSSVNSSRSKVFSSRSLDYYNQPTQQKFSQNMTSKVDSNSLSEFSFSPLASEISINNVGIKSKAVDTASKPSESIASCVENALKSSNVISEEEKQELEKQNKLLAEQNELLAEQAELAKKKEAEHKALLKGHTLIGDVDTIKVVSKVLRDILSRRPSKEEIGQMLSGVEDECNLKESSLGLAVLFAEVYRLLLVQLVVYDESVPIKTFIENNIISFLRTLCPTVKQVIEILKEMLQSKSMYFNLIMFQELARISPGIGIIRISPSQEHKLVIIVYKTFLECEVFTLEMFQEWLSYKDDICENKFTTKSILSRWLSDYDYENLNSSSDSNDSST